MKKRLSQLLMAVAMLATGMASTGCIWFILEEPNSIDTFCE